MLWVLMVGVLTVEGDLSAGMEKLEHHFSRLGAIEVESTHEAEKAQRLTSLRELLDAGAESGDEINALYRAMDAERNWLWEHAAERPERAPGEFVETDDQWTVTTPGLSLEISRADLAMTVTTPDTEWRFFPSDENDMEWVDKRIALRSAGVQKAEPFHTGYSAGMRLTLDEFLNAPDFTLRITAYLTGNELIFDLDAEGNGTAFRSLHWPRSMDLPASESTQSVVPVMQGALIPGDWPQEIIYGGLSNSREFYMPWFGHIVDGHGVLVILETSTDAGGVCQHQAGGPTVMTPRWYASLGQLGHLRTIRYVFQSNADYVSLAKRYRQFVKETGRFVSLREKCARTPALEGLLGSPVIHIGSLYHYVPEAGLYNHDREELNHQLRTFDELSEALRQIHDSGVKNAYVHLDGWGFYGYDSAHPDPLPVGYEQGGWEGLRRFAETCEELGYFFAVHDQYRDFYLNSVSFDERMTTLDINGERFEVSHWCGGPQTVLSGRYAPEYVRRNHDMFRDHGVNVQGAYLDVFSVISPDESSQPGCTITRRETAAFWRQCFDLLRARGYVVSSEEPTDYLLSSIDLVHHGPYARYPDIWQGDAAYGIPVPLFSLVYHDALLIPWDLNLGAWGIPPGESGHLHCLLNAGLPYATEPYGAPSGDLAQQRAAQVKEAAELAKHCAHLEMTNHEFLNEERTRQRTTFSDGTQVTVDFATGDYDIGLGRP